MSFQRSIPTPRTYVQMEGGPDQRMRNCRFCWYAFILLFLLIVTPGAIYFFLSEDVRPSLDRITSAELTQEKTMKEVYGILPLYFDTLRATVYGYLPHVYADTDVSSVDVPIPCKEEPPVDKVISCYYNIPSSGSRASNQLLPSDINPHLCTHINIAFAALVNKEIYLNHHQQESIKELLKLKDVNPKLKMLLSIGGAGNTSDFSKMVIDHASRKTFIKSVKSVLSNLTLDGIDLDWEFPSMYSLLINRTTDRERQHFSQLLREIRAEYVREKRDYLLTIAAAAPEIIVDASYDIDQINLYTDYVNIMTYDFHSYTPYTPFTGLNSPIYARSGEKLFLSTLNINYTCNMYMRKGLDRNKIVIGIPTYGHSFNLVNSDNTDVGSPASGYGKIGTLGFVNYPDICDYIRNTNTCIHVVEDLDAGVPYLYSDHDWLSFDTTLSVENKARFIKDNNLRGAMIYSLNADDYVGTCGDVVDSEESGVMKFPLSHSIRNTLLSENI